jgi:hypothetical protein
MYNHIAWTLKNMSKDSKFTIFNFASILVFEILIFFHFSSKETFLKTLFSIFSASLFQRKFLFSLNLSIHPPKSHSVRRFSTKSSNYQTEIIYLSVEILI